jgi:phage terminase Nu1 subunit (DNA packaging protein)
MLRIAAKGTGQFKKASVGRDLDALLHNILLRLQKRYPNIILAGVDVVEEYSASR